MSKGILGTMSAGAVIFLLALPLRADWASAVRARDNGDYVTALGEFKALAQQGNTQAELSIGNMYNEGDGVTQDYAEAVRWYRTAAEQGSCDGQYLLANMYLQGHGVTQDASQAALWYEKAANQKEGASRKLAANNIGILYLDGNGVATNYPAALKYFILAADQGVADAQCSLGSMYAKGLGIDRNLATAYHWYEKAAEQGDIRAQTELGSMCTRGEGTTKDNAQGSRWYMLAAEQGSAIAQYRYAMACKLGSGVKADNVEAYKWLTLAARETGSCRNLANYKVSSQDLGKFQRMFSADMSTSEITNATGLAQQWKPKREVYDYQTGVWMLLQAEK